ncbi:MAG: nicotinate phosphoribosyltransferase [Thaumarchaeota archaeon]|nr:nicotinate phosphoribosyltransferase [Nitrososphaerota archaeon]MCL5067422.1 nicotinate phosphoribosyltransferase [Nitrososphaerota archaeon]MDG6907815.1 nicotinate phosphoribosyltransferase [Nitrososphaerota archaeon]
MPAASKFRLKSDLSDRLFWIPKEEEIRNGTTTDVYFEYSRDALHYAGINPVVTMEVFTRKNPFGAKWAVVCGIYEVAKLLQGLAVDVDSMEEGEVFITDPNSAVNEPVMRIIGRYQDIAIFETAILGFLSQASGICTKAARISLLAEGKTVISFGTRRVHPALAPTVERSSYIGGLNSVSNVLGAALMRKEPSGTMPHAFILCVGDEKKAWKLFDESLPRKIPRIALIDTFSDEKIGAIAALEALGERLSGVRLDTPGSRRGDIKKLVQEVRWELTARGGRKIKIFVSGGIDETDVKELRDFVDGFGIGTSISAAPVIDFCDKIVEVTDDTGKRVPRSKRGDLGGSKAIYRDRRTYADTVTLQMKENDGKYALLKPLIRKGVLVRKFKSLETIRRATKRSVKEISSADPSVIWR